MFKKFDKTHRKSLIKKQRKILYNSGGGEVVHYRGTVLLKLLTFQKNISSYKYFRVVTEPSQTFRGGGGR